MLSEQLLHTLLIVCPLVFLGGLVDAVAGGGGLITLPAYLLAGLPPHAASATNKCGNVWGTLLATYRFLKRGEVHLSSAVCGGVGALIGAWAGAKLNMIMPERYLYYLMLIIVPVMAVFLLFKREFGTEDHSHELSPRRLLILSLGIGLVMGCYDGFFGPGAGTFLMLAFTGLCKFDLLTASGNTKVANSASNVASLVTFALAGQVVWSVGIPAAICGIAGGYVGSGLALKNGAKVIRPMFFVVLALLTNPPHLRPTFFVKKSRQKKLPAKLRFASAPVTKRNRGNDMLRRSHGFYIFHLGYGRDSSVNPMM